MAELIFILTAIYVAYVIYRVSDDEPSDSDTQPESTTGTETVTASTEANDAPEQKNEQTATAAATEKAETAKQPAPSASKQVRNPETGEIAVIPSNYRFTKRWIKEALVSEGLLDKVYKTTELDKEANAKVKQALAEFSMMEKYRA